MKSNVLAILVVGVLIGGAVMFSGTSLGGSNKTIPANNVSVVDGKQIVDITAKGGYAPRVSTAKANIPTTLRIETKGTFDCSSAITIPSLGYRNNLPPTGTTEIEVPPQKTGTTLQGLCAMGMQNFQINFN